MRARMSKMRKTSKYYPLNWIVECKPEGQNLFETIAAFNCDRAALDYAEDCRQVHPKSWVYCVLERKGNGYNIIEFNVGVKQ